MSVLLTAIEIQSAEVPRRKMGQILNDGMRAIAMRHRMVTLGKHFKKNAETAPGGGYGYVARGVKYMERKQRKYGTDDPNVMTGTLMRHTKNNSVVRATQYRSSVTIKAPHPLKDQQRKELEAVTGDEVADAQKFGQEHVSKAVSDPKNMLKRKRRVT